MDPGGGGEKSDEINGVFHQRKQKGEEDAGIRRIQRLRAESKAGSSPSIMLQGNTAPVILIATGL